MFHHLGGYCDACITLCLNCIVCARVVSRHMGLFTGSSLYRECIRRACVHASSFMQVVCDHSAPQDGGTRQCPPDTSQWRSRKEGNVLFNDALNTFYLRLYGVGHRLEDHSDSERGNPLPPHGLLFPINSKGSFICTIPQRG